MDLNKAMVEMYKKRKLINKQKSLPGKKPKIDQDPNKTLDRSFSGVRDPEAKRGTSIEDVISALDYKPEATFERLHGCQLARDEVIEIVEHFKRSIEKLTTRFDKPVYICGLRGIGKTSIVEAAANYAKLKLIPIFLKTLVEQTRNELKVTLKHLVDYCISNQPALVLIDDLDQVNDKEELRLLVRGAVRRILDEDHELLLFCTALSDEDIATTTTINSLYTIYLKRPDENARYKILESLRMNDKALAHLTDNCLKTIALKTPSFTASNLRDMLEFAKTKSAGQPAMLHCDKAIHKVKRSFKRGTHLIGEKPTVQWKDIGGLSEVRQAFQEILWQLERGDDFDCKFAGIALYGPPGCGKTMVAQAMANEAGLNFISIKPSELQDKYLGETEKNIRRVFSEAREFEPCMIYFDEFDALCGNRGNKNNVTGAIQTLLSEMDGFDSRGKSIILVSTNRLEDIDPAMKRPGRLSEHIYVGLPDKSTRRDILRVVTNRPKMTLADDIDLDSWASITESFSGADLDFLVSVAEKRACSEKRGETGKPVQDITIETRHLEMGLERIKAIKKDKKTRLRSKLASKKRFL